MPIELHSSAALGDEIWLPSDSAAREDAPTVFSSNPVRDIRSQEAHQVMFGDACSTIPDNESTQRQLLEEAVKARVEKPQEEALQSSLSLFGGADDPRSSPALLTSSRLRELQDHDLLGDLPESVEPVLDVTDNEQHSHGSGTRAEDDTNITQMLSSRASESMHEEASVETKPSKSNSRSKKRKAGSDELSSEGLLVGLPPERYIPRLSKRRATTNADHSAGDAANGGKTGQLTRRRTAHAVLQLSSSLRDEIQKSISRQSDTGVEHDFAGKTELSAQDHDMDHSSAKLSSKADVKKKKSKKAGSAKKPLGSVVFGENLKNAQPLKSEPNHVDSSVDSKDATLPTTIEERKTRTNTHGSAAVVLEDSADEDESDNAKHEMSKAPDHRILHEIKNKSSSAAALIGRSKGTRKKSKMIDEHDDELASSANLIVSETQPKRALRSGKRARKAVEALRKDIDEQAQSQDDQTRAEDSALEVAEMLNIEKDTSADVSSEHHSLLLDEQRASKPEQKTEKSAMRAPSPEQSKQPSLTAHVKDVAEEHAAPKDKVSTFIKSDVNASTPYRVGLSKTRRIPSLLKIIRPPKQ